MAEAISYLRLVSSNDTTHIRGGTILPIEIRPEVWDAYEEMRKKIRKPMTLYARQLVIKKVLSMGGDPNDILEQSVMNSWQGVFPLRVTVGDNSGGIDKIPIKSKSLCVMAGCEKLGIIGQGGRMYCRKHDPEKMG